MTVQLLLADAEPVTRLGWTALFRGSELQVVAEVQSASELADLARSTGAAMILTAAVFPDGSGLDAAARLRTDGFSGPILVFSSDISDQTLHRAWAAGVDSFLRRTIPTEELLRIALAWTRLGPDAEKREKSRFCGELRRIIRGRARRSSEPTSPLTARETQVLRMIAAGQSNKMIAASLGRSVDTVKEHVGHILRKLQVSDRTAAAVQAIKTGLVDE